MQDGPAGQAGQLSVEVAHRLRALGRSVSPTEIADVWVFPPLPELETSAEFFLFTRVDGQERRRLYSARLGRNGGARAEKGVPPGTSASPSENGDGYRSPDGLEQVVIEHGAVPADRVERLVERFRRRLGEERDPIHLVVDGRAPLWESLVAENGGGERPAGIDIDTRTSKP